MGKKDAKYWFEEGNKLFDSGNFEKAIKCYAEASGLNPDDADTFHNWGLALSNLALLKQDESLFRESFDKYAQASRLNPDDADTFNNWGNALYNLAELKQDESLFRESFDKYAQASRLNPKNDYTFYNWGNALYDLALLKRDESLFRESFDKYAQASGLNPDDADTFHNWGLALSNLALLKQDESLFRESFDKYAQASKKNPKNADTLNTWGLALSILAELKQDESLFRESFNKYAQASKKNPKNADTFINWGNALYYLALLKQDESLFSKEYKIFEEATEKINDQKLFLVKGKLYLLLKNKDKSIECLRNSKKDFLEIFTFFEKENRESIIQKEVLLPLLDSGMNDDSRFFKETTKNISSKDIDKYKKAYILSVFIINQLHINNKNEKLVAYYTAKVISQKMLFKDKENKDGNISKFRLNAINYSNDSTEGKVLLNYLYGEKCSTKEILSVGYSAFAGCFTFNHDSLNQFRLYGKEKGKEGTGLSLVFRDSFFSKEAKMAIKQLEAVDINFSKDEEEKHSLFRCIYIDPEANRVETVGHKEAYLFYREGNEDKINEYNKYIVSVIKSVRIKMDELKEIVKDLDKDVVSQLLINLRYLTKHIAFKEEQECRIVKIHRLDDKKIQTSDDFKQMFIEYLNIPNYVDKIYFGTKATGIELFQDILKHEGLNIPCIKSTNPLA